MLIDLAILTNRATRIRKIIIVLVKDIQQGAVITSQRVYTPNKEGVLICLSHGCLAELRMRHVRELGCMEDHLIEMTEYTDIKISPLPRNPGT